MSEANDLAKYICTFLNDLDWVVWRNNSGQIKTSGYVVHLSPDGLGDVIGFDPRGHFVHIEIKIGADKIRPKQAIMMARIAVTKHGIVGVITSEKQFHEWFHNCLRIG